MKKKRFIEEQIIGALKEHESGAKVDICRHVGIAATSERACETAPALWLPDTSRFVKNRRFGD